MSLNRTELYRPTVNEPSVHSLIRKSFAFVPSAGMRLAPEILVLELMREIFFEKHFGNTVGTRYLDPDTTDQEHRLQFSDRERAVLYSLRGRRKKSKNANEQRFFAPAYPQLAAGGWLGKNRERVVYNFLLTGPIAQYLWHGGRDSLEGKHRQQELVEKIYRALLGSKSCFDQNLEGKEILAVTLGSSSFNIATDLPKRNLMERTSQCDSVIRMDEDEISSRITLDFIAICDLESKLPRMQWLQLLMTFLRFALPMWLLSQMQITGLLHSWLIDALNNGKVASNDVVISSLMRRNRGLLHPTVTPTRELFEHIEHYMKCRVELDILLCCIEQVRNEQIAGKILNLEGRGRDTISIEQLLLLARDSAKDIRDMELYKSVTNSMDIRTFLTREGEAFAAWRNPLMRGQGKNIDEFFRVLYRAEVGDEAGGYLIGPEGWGVKRGFRVFPGQMLLKTITYLASENKCSSQLRGGAGKLVLQDVEEHFGQYGIDFSMAADARPLLMSELQAMGLLTGSPDAGSSVSVACPY